MTSSGMGGEALDGLVADVQAALSRHEAPWFDPGAGETVLLPEAEGRGYWVGAPSVVSDDEGGRLLLSYRRRRPRDGSPDERGHTAAIAESTDGGRTFTDIWALTKHEVGTSSLERFCLRARGGEWLLYTSWEDPPASGRWRIDVLRAATPERFSLSSAVPVLLPGDVGVDAVKDPYVTSYKGEVFMYVSTFLTPHGPAPTSLATSADGVHFSWQGEVLGVGRQRGQWDAYQARLASLVAFEDGYVAYYDGAATPADDTEEHCGLAASLDLRSWRSVTTGAPVLVSPYATGSLRYVEVLSIEGSPFVYYEYTRPDGSHELRRNPLGGAAG
jgi:hypothetical protein